jgi:hypothetical protein
VTKKVRNVCQQKKFRRGTFYLRADCEGLKDISLKYVVTEVRGNLPGSDVATSATAVSIMDTVQVNIVSLRLEKYARTPIPISNHTEQP